MAFDRENIYRLVRLHVPGAITDSIAASLDVTMRDFCEHTDVWVEQIEVTTEAQEKRYEIISSEGQIVRLLTTVNSGESPVAAALEMEDVLVLGWEPAVVETLTAYVSLKPPVSGNAGCVPEWVYNRYFDGIVHGVVSQMMSQPAKPYTNLALAAYNSRMYKQVVHRAKNESLQGFRFRGTGWSYPQAWR